MANEMKHGSVGTSLSQAEWEGIGTHVFDSQATGDLMYASSASQLARLGIGSTNQVLTTVGGVPSWAAITTVGTIATGVWQGTDVGVAYGGTGASSLTANGVLIGNGTSAVTAVDMSTKGHVIVGDGSGNPQTLAVGTNDYVLTADSGETTGTKWAAAAAAAAGSLTGSTLASGVTASSLTSVGTISTGVWQGTDVAVAYGGTGASTHTANGLLVGNGTSAITAVDMSTKGHVIIGDGSGNPQTLAVGTNDHVMTADSGETTGVKWAAAGAAAAGSLTGTTLASGVVTSSLTTVGTIGTGVWQGTDVGVAYGGTGASSLTANGVLIGNGTSAVTAVDQSTKGHILIGDGSGNPSMLAVGSNDEVLTADSGETTGVKWAAAGGSGAVTVAGSAAAEVYSTSTTTVTLSEVGGTVAGAGLAIAITQPATIWCSIRRNGLLGTGNYGFNLYGQTGPTSTDMKIWPTNAGSDAVGGVMTGWIPPRDANHLGGFTIGLAMEPGGNSYSWGQADSANVMPGGEITRVQLRAKATSSAGMYVYSSNLIVYKFAAS